CSKGLATEAAAGVIEFAFCTLNLHRIEANIIPGNTASIKVAEKLGFVFEGASEKYLLINGEWQKHLHYALINDNWKRD
ncbi:MAG: GNAT family N-acetyltransferase, partial [Ignavibacteria bacterium]|nr:GNAT family N-acetyltransferase [Ignavibacteria bacterium]